MAVRHRGDLPTGDVTFVFSDIEGSTALLRQLGERYHDLLATHHRCLRGAWSRHGGVEVNTEGDAFFVAFADADDAVAATAGAQEELGQAAWPDGSTVLVRMGVHTGWANPRHGDYAALAVNQAARVVSAANGGQVLVSDDTARRLRQLPDGMELESLGPFRVRDFPGPVVLHQVRTAHLPVRDLPPRVRPAAGHNLVRPMTTLHGRSEELAELAGVVRAGALVTLVGPGGVGKTRLAIEHGLCAAPSWPDGVWFVDLAPVTDGARVDDAIAAAVAASAVPGRPTRDDVLAHLEDRSTLLVIDNCEHLAPAPAQAVQALRRHCPKLAVLATSRAPLQLPGERVLRLAPLPVTGARPAAEQLFEERAGEVAAADAEAVSELCRALDGLPLALELAAVKARAVGVPAVLRGLRTSLALLHTDDPTVPQRQRSLTRVLDWSWDLLDDAGRTMLSGLSVLPAGVDLDLVCDAVQHRADLRVTEAEAIDTVASLVDQSLLVRVTGAGATRFVAPPPVRSYALARRPAAAVEAHRAFSRALEDRLGPTRSATWAWVSEMVDQVDNVRALIAGHAGADERRGQALAWSVGQHHDITAAYATGIDEVRGHLDLLASPTPERVGLLCLLADLMLRLGDVAPAGAAIAEAEALAARVGAPSWDDGVVDRSRAYLLLRSGHPEEALRIAGRGLATARTARSRARLQAVVGSAFVDLGSPVEAASAFGDLLAFEVEAGLEVYAIGTAGNLAEISLQLGDAVAAARYQLRALEDARAYQDEVIVVLSVLLAANLAAGLGRSEVALELAVAGWRGLDRTGVALHSSDRATYSALVADLEASLGATVAGAARRRAEQRSLADVADLATEVLRDVLAA